MYFLDFFGGYSGTLDPSFFEQWEKCIKSWINEEIDKTLEKEIESDLKTMSQQAEIISDSLENVDHVDEGLYINLMHELSILKTASDDIKSMVIIL